RRIGPGFFLRQPDGLLPAALGGLFRRFAALRRAAVVPGHTVDVHGRDHAAVVVLVKSLFPAHLLFAPWPWRPPWRLRPRPSARACHRGGRRTSGRSPLRSTRARRICIPPCTCRSACGTCSREAGWRERAGCP